MLRCINCERDESSENGENGKSRLTELVLGDAHTQCPRCETIYPHIGTVPAPAFFKQPADAIADAYITFHRAVKDWQNRIQELSEGIKTSERKQALLPFLKAMNDNKAHFQEYRDSIKELVDIPTLLERATKPTSNHYGFNFNYLERDWTSSAQSIKEIEQVNALLDLALSYCTYDNSYDYIAAADKTSADNTGPHTLMLGAGNARAAVDLQAKGYRVIAVDNSLGQFLQFRQLLEQPINYWRIRTQNIRSDRDMLQKCTAAIPEELAPAAAAINYYWCDAAQLPLADQSMDIVVAHYFSDVIPINDLLAEVKRVLRPNGYFIHLGPLHYHFSDITQHHSLEAFVSQLERFKLEVVHNSEHLFEPVIDEASMLIPQRYRNSLIVAKMPDTESEVAD